MEIVTGAEVHVIVMPPSEISMAVLAAGWPSATLAAACAKQSIGPEAGTP
jgi:hypothetical protein